MLDNLPEFIAGLMWGQMIDIVPFVVLLILRYFKLVEFKLLPEPRDL